MLSVFLSPYATQHMCVFIYRLLLIDENDQLTIPQTMKKKSRKNSKPLIILAWHHKYLNSFASD